jgi:hypothetical protein
MENNKKSKLIFDPRITRRLLKMNGEIKFCPFCGKSISEKCECHKNIIIDTKPLRGGNGESISVFDNNESFQADLAQIMDEIKAKKEEEHDPTFEQLTSDIA